MSIFYLFISTLGTAFSCHFVDQAIEFMNVNNIGNDGFSQFLKKTFTIAFLGSKCNATVTSYLSAIFIYIALAIVRYNINRLKLANLKNRSKR